TYWIDAVVVVDAARAQSWRSLPGLAPAVAAPTVHPELTDRLPAGPLLTGPELDSLLSQDGFVTTAYLAQTTDQVVIVAVGQ
ncbi:MAG: hypothetical protein LBS56_06825, partial [Propionibacteriaceae bacterium]|nr:hypothetical protein [Propionibacteriaceae bacterium]